MVVRFAIAKLKRRQRFERNVIGKTHYHGNPAYGTIYLFQGMLLIIMSTTKRRGKLSFV